MAHLVILALVEGCQIKLVDWQGLPQPQIAYCRGLVSRDGVVIGFCNDLQGTTQICFLLHEDRGLLYSSNILGLIPGLHVTARASVQ